MALRVGATVSPEVGVVVSDNVGLLEELDVGTALGAPELGKILG